MGLSEDAVRGPDQPDPCETPEVSASAELVNQLRPAAQRTAALATPEQELAGSLDVAPLQQDLASRELRLLEKPVDAQARSSGLPVKQPLLSEDGPQSSIHRSQLGRASFVHDAGQGVYLHLKQIMMRSHRGESLMPPLYCSTKATRVSA